MAYLSDTSPDEIQLARERFSASQTAWAQVRKQYNIDSRFVNKQGGQWAPEVLDARQDAGRPAMEFDETHTYVQQVVNAERQNRPQPQIAPGDDVASKATAEFKEARLRHIWYASQADVACDTGIECAATGGIGWIEVTAEYVSPSRPEQEPRIRRILDPMTVYCDGDVMEPDYSDMMFAFKRQKVHRKSFKAKFGEDPVEFDMDDRMMSPWSEKEYVYIAQYWEVELKRVKKLYVADGSVITPEDMEILRAQGLQPQIINERWDEDRQVWCKLIDGHRVIERTPWLGKWIPLVPVLGREVIVEGERQLISLIRYAQDSQRMKNVYKSGVAGVIQDATLAPWVGVKGQFKDPRWRDAHMKRYGYLEYEPVSINGTLAPPPQRNTYEAPIQALATAAIQESDDIRRSVGYTDAVLTPSRTQLSGVALERRQAQQSLTNSHFQDNLIRAQWHLARVVCDLDAKLADTPRMLMGRRENGDTFRAPIVVGGQMVQGQEDQQHHSLDQGEYTFTIVAGKSYATKQEEELDRLVEVLKVNPNQWVIYAPRVFELMGYDDLSELAKLAWPPAIQQAMLAKEENIPPAAAMQIAALKMQTQQMGEAIQKLVGVLQSKQVESKGKLDVERLKLIGDLMKVQLEQAHETGIVTLEQRVSAVGYLMDMLNQATAQDKQIDADQQSAAFQAQQQANQPQQAA